MLADGIDFLRFYDAACILSAIAKFLVHLLGKGRNGVKWEGRGRGRMRGGKREAMENELHEK